MLTKFETKSNRVKGLSFHPKRPWILASLHSGVIQLWDYRMGTLLDRFDEHDGPVRGVDFHSSQPLFVSGGDDYKIKVWNYKLRRCLFTLLGHLDYIRTVEFHAEHPWIVSASDDQTVRLWNWQSRTCLAVLTGHNHYVMCAGFHPRDDLVVSASLDQTVRVWDVSALRAKTANPGGGGGGGMGGGGGGMGGMGMGGGYDDPLRGPGGGVGGGGGMMGGGLAAAGADLFGGGDVLVKHVLEGHDRGVNWAAFHPSLPLIVSGADDRTVKLWRMNDTKAWEVDTLRGHANNVSCVLFHARQDCVVSDSEDRTVRVWDLSKRAGVQTFRREADRFWVLAVHPHLNLLAAGHDAGMLVFKLERERPAFALTGAGAGLVYVRDRHLRSCDLASGDDHPLATIRRAGGVGSGSAPRSLSFNPAEGAALVTNDLDGGSYELYMLPREALRPGGGAGDAAPEPKKGSGAAAVFVARNRFAVLDRPANSLHIKNLRNETTKSLPSPLPSTDAIFYAGTGALLVKGDGDRVVLFDVQQRAVLGEVSAPGAKYAVWSPDGGRVALLCKHAVVLADKKLAAAVTVHETIRVKSAAWDPAGVLLYSTLNHVKYALPSGDAGTVRTLDAPLYLVAVDGRRLHCLDRDGAPRVLEVDPSEYVFKLALAQRRFDTVLGLVRSGALCGQAVIAYLRAQGFPEVALHFVRDDRTRFALAVECGNVEVALDAAQALDDPETWRALGAEAVRHGNVAAAEFAFQRVRDYGRLAFLYLVAGAGEKLAKVGKLVASRGDARTRFQLALYAGDAAARVAALEAAGLVPLAAAAAAAAGLDDDAARLAEAGGEAGARGRAAGAAARAAGPPPPGPPAPLMPADNWPLLAVSKGLFESLAAKAGPAGSGGPGGGSAGGRAGGAAGAAAAAVELDDEDVGAAWGDAEDLDLDGSGAAAAAAATTSDAAGWGGAGAGEGEAGDDDDEDGGWAMEDLDLPPAGGAGAGAGGGGAGGGAAFVPPAPGAPPESKWLAGTAVHPADAAAAGAPDAAMRALARTIGAAEFAPFRPHFAELRAATFAAVPGLPGTPGFSAPLGKEWAEDDEAGYPAAPALPYTLAGLEDRVRSMYKLVTEGKFSEGLKAADALLAVIPLTVVANRREADEVKELVSIAREYNIGLRCELERKAATDPKRAAELAAYFTHARLQPAHAALALRAAMVQHYKAGNLALASGFAARLLEVGALPAKIGAQARQVAAACEKDGPPTDAMAGLAYEPRNPFDLCAGSFVPIYRGAAFVEDPYTGARFVPEWEGKVSPVGGIARIGGEASGLASVREEGRRR